MNNLNNYSRVLEKFCGFNGIILDKQYSLDLDSNGNKKVFIVKSVNLFDLQNQNNHFTLFYRKIYKDRFILKQFNDYDTILDEFYKAEDERWISYERKLGKIHASNVIFNNNNELFNVIICSDYYIFYNNYIKKMQILGQLNNENNQGAIYIDLINNTSHFSALSVYMYLNRSLGEEISFKCVNMRNENIQINFENKKVELKNLSCHFQTLRTRKFMLTGPNLLAIGNVNLLSVSNGYSKIVTLRRLKKSL